MERAEAIVWAVCRVGDGLFAVGEGGADEGDEVSGLHIKGIKCEVRGGDGGGKLDR